MKTLTAWFRHFDCWLCVTIPFHNLRLWWHRLWIRSDEFHPSLRLDVLAITAFETRQKRSDDGTLLRVSNSQSDRTLQYIRDLLRRRDIAHEQSL